MKLRNSFLMITLFMICVSLSLNAQQQEKKPRPSLKAGVSQTIGFDTDIKIVYSRPGVKGRKIWGDLVPYGLAPAGKEPNSKPFPWRGGANENTTIEFSKDVLVEGNKVPAGKYALHFIPGENEWTVIINKKNKDWGSYSYDQAEDLIRFKVTPVKAPFQEWLAYGFGDLNGTSATAYLQWEELKVPFKIAVAD
jgi:Protein of unknown function (DUF2911)